MNLQPLLVPVSFAGRSIGNYDLRVLLVPHGHLHSAAQTSTVGDRILQSEVEKHRLNFIASLHVEITSRARENASLRSLGNTITHLRAFMSFVDVSNRFPRQFSPQEWRSVFAQWVASLWHRVNQGTLKERSAGTYTWSIANLIASVFELPVEEFVGRTLMPRINIGSSSERYQNIDVAAVNKYLEDLEDIISSLPGYTEELRWPLWIKFRDGACYELPAQGPLSTGRRRLLNFHEGKRLLGTRTEAEMLRFIAITGCNLQVASDLEVGELSFESFKQQYQISGFKNRKGDFVLIKIPRTYRPKLESWLEFRKACFPAESYKRLFPLLDRQYRENSLAADRGFRRVKDILEGAGRPTFAAQKLRFARAQRLLRTRAISGGIDLVAERLQNTVSTLHRSYLRGDLQLTTVEFGKFVRSIAPSAATHRLRNGGACTALNSPERIEQIKAEAPEPNCTNPAGCLFCANFRAVADFDSLHSLLSYRQFLRIRGSFNSTDANDLSRTVIPTIERINDHIEAISALASQNAEMINRSQALVADGTFHAHWRGWIELISLRAE